MRKTCNCMQSLYKNTNNAMTVTENVKTQPETCNMATSPLYNSMPEKCSCGYDEDTNGLPENPVLAQSYVPIQEFNQTFPCEKALKMGTLFPELVSPYYPGQSICEINKIKSQNEKGVCDCGNM